MAEVIMLKEGDALILKTNCKITHEDAEREAEWFRNKMGIEVRIIDDMYDIAGVEERGERIC